MLIDQIKVRSRDWQFLQNQPDHTSGSSLRRVQFEFGYKLSFQRIFSTTVLLSWQIYKILKWDIKFTTFLLWVITLVIIRGSCRKKTYTIFDIPPEDLIWTWIKLWYLLTQFWSIILDESFALRNKISLKHDITIVVQNLRLTNDGSQMPGNVSIWTRSLLHNTEWIGTSVFLWIRVFSRHPHIWMNLRLEIGIVSKFQMLPFQRDLLCMIRKGSSGWNLDSCLFRDICTFLLPKRE